MKIHEIKKKFFFDKYCHYQRSNNNIELIMVNNGTLWLNEKNIEKI